MFSQEPSSDVVTSLENLDGVIEKAVAIAVDEFKKGDEEEGGGRGGRGGGGRVSWCMPINNTHDTFIYNVAPLLICFSLRILDMMNPVQGQAPP